MLPLTLAINWTITLLAAAFVLVCLFMMLVILIQKPKGGGLSGAFGGGGGSAQAAFGAKTGDVLTYFTVACFVLFLLLAMGLTWAIRPEHERMLQQVSTQSSLEAALDEATGGIPTVATDTGDVPAAGAAADQVGTPPVEPGPAPEAAPAAQDPAPSPPVEAPAPPAPEAAPEAPAAPAPAQP